MVGHVMRLEPQVIQQVVATALAEDIGWGDVTTEALLPNPVPARAEMVAKEAGIIAGLPVFAAVFRAVDADLCVTLKAHDGERIAPGQWLATVEGDARSILKGERVALNLVQRMSGIATETARYVAALGNSPTRILDTRKTTPGLRALEKYAVRVGGGANHRFALCDAVLIKDNHLALARREGLDIAGAIRRVRQAVGAMARIEIEVTTPEEAKEAADAGAEIILLDNMTLEAICRAVALVGGRAQLEVSGGVTLARIPALAACGVNFISVGALTHSVRALDISLEIRE